MCRLSRLLLLMIVLITPLSPARPALAAESVAPIVWASLSAGAPSDADAQRLRAILRNTNRYALTTWWNTTKDFDAQTGAYLSFGGTSEQFIRPAAAEALALAISLQAGAYDSTATGVSASEARAIAVRLTTSLAYRHRATSSGGWGHAWQSALWAALTGLSGWLLWDDLSATHRNQITAMVISEANRFNNTPAPYFRDAGETIISPGDSKGEENSWNATLLQLATAMLPAHPNWHTWMDRNLEYMLSAYARPSDITSSTLVNGKALSEWLNGSNIEPDGMMINHDRIHPDYTATVTQNAHAALVYTLAGQPTPRAALYNADSVYAAVVDLNFVVGSNPYPSGGAILSPGGTIYRSGSGNIYYPQGNDWGTQRRMNFAGLDAFARAFGFDNLASTKASVWEPLHAQVVLDMQSRFSDGRTYGANSEDTYAGREEWVAMLAGRAYLAKWLAHQGTFSITDRSYTSSTASEIIVDNLDAGVRQSAGWTVSSANPARYGPNYLHDGTTGKGQKWVTYQPSISVAGSYEVFLIWHAAGNRASNVPITISYSGGSSTVLVNQQLNDGQWVSVGVYPFATGTSGSVTISNTSTAQGTYVMADAVRLVPVGD
jgi:hypothetical protein